MVSLSAALLHAKNTMKNNIGDADYIINRIDLIHINQHVKNSYHSHSIVAGGLLEISYDQGDQGVRSLEVCLNLSLLLALP